MRFGHFVRPATPARAAGCDPMSGVRARPRVGDRRAGQGRDTKLPAEPRSTVGAAWAPLGGNTRVDVTHTSQRAPQSPGRRPSGRSAGVLPILTTWIVGLRPGAATGPAGCPVGSGDLAAHACAAAIARTDIRGRSACMTDTRHEAVWRWATVAWECPHEMLEGLQPAGRRRKQHGASRFRCRALRSEGWLGRRGERGGRARRRGGPSARGRT